MSQLKAYESFSFISVSELLGFFYKYRRFMLLIMKWKRVVPTQECYTNLCLDITAIRWLDIMWQMNYELIFCLVTQRLLTRCHYFIPCHKQSILFLISQTTFFHVFNYPPCCLRSYFRSKIWTSFLKIIYLVFCAKEVKKRDYCCPCSHSVTCVEFWKYHIISFDKCINGVTVFLFYFIL